MKRWRWAALGVVAAAAVVTAEARQDPAPQGPPVFRAGTDVIELDVSVLGKDRQPVRGLTAADFTVLEDGKPQRVVAISEVIAAENDPELTARMRHVARDVAVNDLSDQLGDGRLFGIVLDDRNIPGDDVNMVMETRAIAHSIVDGLGPSDLAAVMLAVDAGDTADFTSDRARLGQAIDKFSPPLSLWIPDNPGGAGPIGGDIMRSSPTLALSRCLRNQPVVPALQALISRLGTVPQKRKTVVLISVGAPIGFSSGSGCPGVYFDAMRGIFRDAQLANVNIYAIDPGGYGGYANYLERARMRSPGGVVMDATRQPRAGAAGLQNFLRTTAENTGGGAAVNTDDFDSVVEQIFTEDGSYYLLGYQTENGRPDGRYRKIQVKVNRPGVTVRSRSGRWAPTGDDAFPTTKNDVPASNELHLAGMFSPQALKLRASALPLARAPDGRGADVALVLTVRAPSPLRVVPETLTVIRNVYDADERAGPPTKEVFERTLQPVAGAELQYDVVSRLTLAPGRYQVRLNVSSAALSRSGSVYADVEVEDFSRAPIALSAIALSAGAESAGLKETPLGGLVPFQPVNNREFAPSEPLRAFVRVFEGGASPAPATVSTEILDMFNHVVFTRTDAVPADGFDPNRSSVYDLRLPIDALGRGPYLLTITAASGGRTARRDVLFKIR